MSAHASRDPILRLKDQGNASFQHEDYRSAVQSYTDALHLLEQSHLSHSSPDIVRVLLSNRAAAYYAWGEIWTAMRDGDLALSPSYTRPDAPKALTAKLHSRRASLQLAFRRVDDAEHDYEAAITLQAEIGQQPTEQMHRLERQLEQASARLSGSLAAQEKSRIDLMHAVEARGLLIPAASRDTFPDFPLTVFGSNVPNDGQTVAFATDDEQLDRMLSNPYRKTPIRIPLQIQAPFLKGVIPRNPQRSCSATAVIEDDRETVNDHIEGVFGSLCMYYGPPQSVMMDALAHDSPANSVVLISSHRGRIFIVPRTARFRDVFHSMVWPKHDTLSDPPLPNARIPFNTTWTEPPRIELMDRRNTPRRRDFDIDGAELTHGCLIELYVVPKDKLEELYVTRSLHCGQLLMASDGFDSIRSLDEVYTQTGLL